MTNPEGPASRRTAPALIAAAATFGTLLSGPALAQPASVGGVAVGSDPGQPMNVTVGVGPAIAPDYEGSDDYELVPFFNLRAGNLYHPETYVQVVGARLVSNFLPHDHWRLGIVGQFIRERDDVEDDRVDDLKSVDASVLLGLIAGYDFLATPQHDLVIEAEARQDVAGDNGFLGSLRLRYGTPLGERWRLDASVGTSWASEDYMSSYFGIDAGDAARSGLDEYNADEGFKDASVGATLTYRFLGNWSVAATGLYTRLIGDAEDSPVVADRGDENQFVAGALVSYRF